MAALVVAVLSLSTSMTHDKQYQEQVLRHLALYAREGWVIVPLFYPTYPEGDDHAGAQCSCQQGTLCAGPAKHACLKRYWEKGASDLERLKWLWFRMNHPARLNRSFMWNIGLLPGQSGVFALDIDLHDEASNGVKALAELEAKYGKLPATVETRSGSNRPGAGHRYFRADPRILSDFIKLRPGLELISGGTRLVVQPPSWHISGNQYLFRTGHDLWTTEVATAPEWFIQEILAAERRFPAAAPRRSTFIEPGPREEAFSQAAREYSLDNTPDDWPRGRRGACPVCGGSRGFTVIREASGDHPAWWDCKSASHQDVDCGRVNQDGSRGGTALDIDAYRAGMDKRSYLIMNGYLEE